MSHGCEFTCRLSAFKKIYEYDGKETCAADGMCQEKCPVKINTGELIKDLRARDVEASKAEGGIAMVTSPPSFQGPLFPELLYVLRAAAACLGTLSSLSRMTELRKREGSSTYTPDLWRRSCVPTSSSVGCTSFPRVRVQSNLHNVMICVL